jgi:hypothetical protein
LQRLLVLLVLLLVLLVLPCRQTHPIAQQTE